MNKSLVELAAEIVQSQTSTKNISMEELQTALKDTFTTLQNLQKIEGGEETIDESEMQSAVSPQRSILKNKIICIECGQEFKMLSSKHLQSHGLTGREYRKKHGFSLRQPLCAKSLTEKRKKAGKKRGIPVALKQSIADRKKKRATAKK